MFYCIGESGSVANSFGKGETIEAAIRDWASSPDDLDIIEEFKCYQPSIINGELIDVEMNVSISFNKKD